VLTVSNWSSFTNDAAGQGGGGQPVLSGESANNQLGLDALGIPGCFAAMARFGLVHYAGAYGFLHMRLQKKRV
jgi:hypothetical protein